MGKVKRSQNKPMAKAQAANELTEIKRLDKLCETVGLEENEGTESAITTKFSSLPISNQTKMGLKEAGYLDMTNIQYKAIPAALRGKDVLVAARTGSGKTLAFVLPIIETLYRQKWSDLFGLGALVISPTRELAYQTFEVLRKVGKKHTLSAGLVIGGKDVEAEQGTISRMNILVCTPGRLLQHMDETPGFVCDDLQILVLDEADRIMDLGFSETMNAIIANLPKSRQTLLFSATQEKSVKDLARLSLKSPEYVTAGDHDTSSNSGEASEYQAPPKLTQVYLVCDLQRKLDILYSFLRTHTKDKILVFMSSCKQVRYVYEAFRNARPGLPLLALHGQQKQAKRMAMYNSYTKKSEACLFATDIAARGLDFPSVNWVIQMDCPEDVATYIHRSGRTARYKADGKALLMLLPSEEEAMLAKITERNIQLQRIKMDEKKLTSCVNHVSNLCAKDADMKHLAQRSFVSYVRSVHLQADKEVFNVGKLPLEEYALSLGLSKAPKIRFVKKIKKHFGAQADRPEAHLSKKEAINVLKQTQKSPDENSDAAGSDGEAEDKGWDVDVDDDDDLLIVNPDQSKVAQLDSEDDAQVAQELEKARKKKEKTKAAKAKKELSKGATNTKVKFIDGEAHTVRGTAPEAADDGYEGGIDIEAVKQKLKEENVKDKAADRERLKQRKRERKIKEKKRLAGSDSEDDGADGPVVVTLGGDDAQEDSEDESHNAAGAESDGEYSDYERPGASRGTKRNRSSGSESSDDDADANNNNNATTDAFSSKRARAMQRDEALALQMLDM